MVAVFTYLITNDLAETLDYKYRIKLSSRYVNDVKRLGNEFIERFWSAIGMSANIETCSRDAGELSAKLTSMLRDARVPSISMDRVYVPYAKDYLEVTRRIDPETLLVQIGERPGTKPLANQIASLKQYGEIALADVGVYTGGTFVEVCSMLEQQGVRVREVYLAVAPATFNFAVGPKGKLKVADIRSSYRKVRIAETFNFFEWTELRDLVGIDGRSVGLRNGVREFIPYWENLNEWASVSILREDAAINLCKEYNESLLSLVRSAGYNPEKSIGRAIKLTDLPGRPSDGSYILTH